MAIVVSIIVPVFNLADYIIETLDSILGQTFPDFEALVIDDNSTDGTVEIVRQYQAKDTRIKLLSNRQKKGAAGARNTGIYAAQGEWIAFLDGDDIWTADAIKVRLDCLNQYPDTKFISADIASFTGNISQVELSRVTANRDWNTCFSHSLATGIPVCINKPIITFLRSVVVHTDTVCIQTQLLKDIGGFDESLPAFEDIQLWMKVACHAETLVFAPKTIAFYRQREGSLMHSSKAIHHYAPRAYLTLLADPIFAKYPSELKDNIRDFNHQNCFYYRKQKNYREAFLWSIQGVYWEPFSSMAWKNFLASCLLR